MSKSYFFSQIPISEEDPVGVKKTGGELAATLGVWAWPYNIMMSFIEDFM